MSNNATINQRIPINKVSASESLQQERPLITDAQSAVQSSIDSFNNYSADYSLMQDDPALSRNPHTAPRERPAGTKTHADFLNSDVGIQQEEPFENNIVNEPVHTQAALEQQPLEEPKRETQREFNLRVLREQKEAAEAKVKNLEAMLAQNPYAYQQQQQFYQNQLPQQYQQQPQQPIEEINIEDDAFIEGKQLKKYISQIKQEFKRDVQRIQAQSAESAAEARLKMQFNDFEQVVNPENIKNFAAIYPEEYKTMLSNPDVYAAGKTAYTLIKNLGIVDIQRPVQSQQSRYADQDRRIQENLKKPRTAARVGSYAEPALSTSTLGKLGEYNSTIGERRRTLSEADKRAVREKYEQSRTYSTF